MAEQYRVTITYIGLTPASDQVIYEIARHYRPIPNYTDSAAFENSVYNTNNPNISVRDNIRRSGSSGMATTGPQMPPFDATQIPFPVPLTQFRLASVGDPVTFVVSDYKEAFAYKQLAVDMLDQGFEIKVELIP